MAKVQAKTKRSASQRKEIRDHRSPRIVLFAILVAIPVLIVGNFFYDLYLDHQDKQRFETVRRSVEVLHERLQGAAGPGEEWEMEALCGQGSVKFQEPLKTCDLFTSAEIAISTSSQADAVIKKYSPIFNTSDLFIFQKRYKKPNNFPKNLKPGLSGVVYREKKLA